MRKLLVPSALAITLLSSQAQAVYWAGHGDISDGVYWAGHGDIMETVKDLIQGRPDDDDGDDDQGDGSSEGDTAARMEATEQVIQASGWLQTLDAWLGR